MATQSVLLAILFFVFLAQEGEGVELTISHPGRKGHVIYTSNDGDNICLIKDDDEHVIIKELTCSMKHHHMVIQEKRGFYCAVLTNNKPEEVGILIADRLLFDKNTKPETDICGSIQIIEDSDLELKVKLSMSEYNPRPEDNREVVYTRQRPNAWIFAKGTSIHVNSKSGSTTPGGEAKPDAKHDSTAVDPKHEHAEPHQDKKEPQNAEAHDQKKEPQNAEAHDQKKEPQHAEAHDQKKEPQHAEAHDQKKEPQNAEAHDQKKEPQNAEAHDQKKEPQHA